MESRLQLRDWSLSDWPADDFTLAGNLQDLAEHQQEHEEGSAFTYTILTPDRTACLGCVYVKPLAPLFAAAHEAATGERPAFAARVYFWVRTSRLADGLDRRVLAHLRGWFGDEWQLDRVVFATSDRAEQQQRCLEEAGLRRAYRVPLPGGYFLAYL